MEHLEKSLELNKQFVESKTAEELDEFMREFDDEDKTPPRKTTLIILGILVYAFIGAIIYGLYCLIT